MKLGCFCKQIENLKLNMVVPKPNPTKDKLLQLMAEKDKIEARIQEFGDILGANANVGLSGPLVDADGFPRNDIDVYQVRQARQQIICLQNDHKELMKQIEDLMHKLHAETAAEKQNEQLSNKAAGMHIEETNDTDASSSCSATTPLSVFVKVNLVSPGSPAEEAGLRIGDGILEFGTINSRNFGNNLNEIANVVRHMQNQRVSLKVQRERQVLDLILIPRTWSGRGLLGCNIVLPESIER